MSTGTCERCGVEFEIGEDPFTSVSVSFHDDERDDFALSVCQACGDELLDEIIALDKAGEEVSA